MNSWPWNYRTQTIIFIKELWMYQQAKEVSSSWEVFMIVANTKMSLYHFYRTMEESKSNVKGKKYSFIVWIYFFLKWISTFIHPSVIILSCTTECSLFSFYFTAKWPGILNQLKLDMAEPSELSILS